MSKKLIGFISDLNVCRITKGTKYLFTEIIKDAAYFIDDEGLRKSVTVSLINGEYNNHTPIYKEIDLDLLQRARDMVEHLKTLKPEPKYLVYGRFKGTEKDYAWKHHEWYNRTKIIISPMYKDPIHVVGWDNLSVLSRPYDARGRQLAKLDKEGKLKTLTVEKVLDK